MLTCCSSLNEVHLFSFSGRVFGPVVSAGFLEIGLAFHGPHGAAARFACSSLGLG